MDAFSYLSVLISIVLALGMTQVLAGVGQMLQARAHQRLYWVHVMWVVNVFIYLTVAWWIFYRWRDQQPWTFYLFVFVLIAPTILYLAALLLFPAAQTGADHVINYKTHFYANHRAFFVLMLLWGVDDNFDSLLKGVAHYQSLGWPYVASNVFFLTGMTIAAITRNERYHSFYAIFFLVQTFVVSFEVFRTLM